MSTIRSMLLGSVVVGALPLAACQQHPSAAEAVEPAYRARLAEVEADFEARKLECEQLEDAIERRNCLSEAVTTHNRRSQEAFEQYVQETQAELDRRYREAR